MPLATSSTDDADDIDEELAILDFEAQFGEHGRAATCANLPAVAAGHDNFVTPGQRDLRKPSGRRP